MKIVGRRYFKMEGLPGMRKIIVVFFFCFVLLLDCAVCASSAHQAAPQKGLQHLSIKVGVFNGSGASPVCVVETYEALRIDRDIALSLLSATDILKGGLDSIDVIVFPGGSGSRQNNNLGSGLRNKIRDFVLKEGNGIVGICAGAYLVSDTEGYPCLNLIEAHAIDLKHDKRGSALAKVLFLERGFEIFPEMKPYPYGYIQYHDGPLFTPSKKEEESDYDELAIFKSDIHLTGDAPAGITPDKPFLLCQELGKGRVFACAGHPESTRGMRWVVPRMVRWAAKKELVSYTPDVVRPYLGKNEVLHSDQMESELFWKLFSDEPEQRIAALKDLVDMRYRNGVRWAVGLLRDTSSEVRLFAAEVLAEAEYTAAIGDLEAAVSVENKRSEKIKLREYLDRLKLMCHEAE